MIGLSGKIGSGKDLAASIILKYFPNYEKVAFADNVKKIGRAHV